VVVVFCVVDVVIEQSWFVVTKNVTRILDLFFGLSCFGKEIGSVWGWSIQMLRWLFRLIALEPIDGCAVR
jgi:hypothetical protein